MVSLLLIIFTLLCMFSVIAVVLFGRPPHRRQCAGVVIHSVPSERARNLSAFPLQQFSSYCRLLQKNNYTTVPLNRYSGSRRHNTICITFDDGFEDFYRNAFPVLQRYGMTATVFIVSGFIGKKSTWDTLSPNLHLNKSQIRVLHRNGIEIGSHTVTHPNLTFLSPKDIRTELLDSRVCLEDIIGAPVTSLSFPFGCWNTRVWDIARECGYTCGTVYRGWRNAPAELYPVWGAYSIDSAEDLWEKAVSSSKYFSSARARARMLTHFAKGTPVWRFRRSYRISSIFS